MKGGEMSKEYPKVNIENPNKSWSPPTRDEIKEKDEKIKRKF